MGEGWTQYWYMGGGVKGQMYYQVHPRKVLDPREEQRRRGHLQEHFDKECVLCVCKGQASSSNKENYYYWSLE
jgi:hypothetical protein